MRIKNYPYDPNVTVNDYVIGTDSVTGKSYSYKITDVLGGVPPTAVEDLSNVVFTNLASGETFQWDGVNWVNVPMPVSDKTYSHVQSVPAASWVITHNLGKYPAVMVMDSSFEVVVGNIVYDSINQLTVTFSGAFSGRAELN